MGATVVDMPNYGYIRHWPKAGLPGWPTGNGAIGSIGRPSRPTRRKEDSRRTWIMAQYVIRLGEEAGYLDIQVRNTFLSRHIFLPVSPSSAIYIKPDGSRPRGRRERTLGSHCIQYTSGFSPDIVRLQE